MPTEDPRLRDLQLTFVESMDDVQRMFTWLGERRFMLAVDTETEGLNVGRDKVRLCQFGDATQGFALDWSKWKGVCADVIHKYDRPMVAHNLLFDSKMLKRDGVVIPQKLAHDTMVMAFLQNSAGKMSLKQACDYYVDHRSSRGQHLLKQAFAANSWNWATVPVDLPVYWQYAVLDTCLTAMLAEKLWDTTVAAYPRAYNLEMAAIHTLREAELAGLQTDPGYRILAKAKLGAELDALEAQIGFRPSKDRQVIEYLHNLGARWDFVTENGNISVDKHVLAWLSAQGYGTAGLISQWRNRSRMLTNYFEGFDALSVDDVVYANTRPLEARTGRMSVTQPALQTLPRGRVVRDAFLAREGSLFVMADFSGMEMRALASFAKEPAMLAAYDAGEDLHNFVARSLYGPNFTKPQRTICKNAGFAKVYGAGVEKFAETAGILVPEAQQFLAQYDEMFPGVGQFMGQVSVEVVRRAGGRKKGYGYVTAVDGRRLPVEADESYKGVNYLIQGSCAISMKEKMVELDQAGLGEYFRLSVHDELIFEVPIAEAREAQHIIEAVMPDRRNFPGVVLEIESDIVHRWGQHYRDDFPKYIETEDPAWLLAA